MAEIKLAPARALVAPPSSFIYGRMHRPVRAWHTGLDEAAIAGICSESDGGRGDRPGALPDDANAIRYQFEEDEPPAVVFNDQAAPGALVSWAWSQLMALDALLAAVLEKSSDNDGEPDVVGAVRTVIVPVINALRFSERRAAELPGADLSQPAKGRKIAPSRRRRTEAGEP